jgi:hypothetical protein
VTPPAFPLVPGVPAAGHVSRGFWHPGPADGCPKCPPPRTPYIRRPHIGDRIQGPTGVETVIRVIGRTGEQIVTTDRIGREWHRRRAPSGTWVRAIDR